MKKILCILAVLCMLGCRKDVGIIGGADGPTVIYVTSSKTPEPTAEVMEEKSEEAEETEPAAAEMETEEGSWFYTLPQPLQETDYYCAVACLQAVLEYHGIEADQADLAEILHTDPVTGTEYEDLARVATALIFPKGDGLYSSVIPENTAEERELFEQRLIQDMKTGDPVFVSIGMHAMYGVKDFVHEVVICGMDMEQGGITAVYYLDPAPSMQDAVYGGLKIVSMDELWYAMLENKEPGYVY